MEISSNLVAFSKNRNFNYLALSSSSISGVDASFSSVSAWSGSVSDSELSSCQPLMYLGDKHNICIRVGWVMKVLVGRVKIRFFDKTEHTP